MHTSENADKTAKHVRNKCFIKYLLIGFWIIIPTDTFIVAHYFFHVKYIRNISASVIWRPAQEVGLVNQHAVIRLQMHQYQKCKTLIYIGSNIDILLIICIIISMGHQMFREMISERDEHIIKGGSIYADCDL